MLLSLLRVEWLRGTFPYFLDVQGCSTTDRAGLVGFPENEAACSRGSQQGLSAQWSGSDSETEGLVRGSASLIFLEYLSLAVQERRSGKWCDAISGNPFHVLGRGGLNLQVWKENYFESGGIWKDDPRYC